MPCPISARTPTRWSPRASPSYFLALLAWTRASRFLTYPWPRDRSAMSWGCEQRRGLLSSRKSPQPSTFRPSRWPANSSEAGGATDAARIRSNRATARRSLGLEFVAEPHEGFRLDVSSPCRSGSAITLGRYPAEIHCWHSWSHLRQFPTATDQRARRIVHFVVYARMTSCSPPQRRVRLWCCRSGDCALKNVRNPTRIRPPAGPE